MNDNEMKVCNISWLDSEQQQQVLLTSSESDVDVCVIGVVRTIVLYEYFRDDFRPHSEGEGEGGALDTYRQLRAVARRDKAPGDQRLGKEIQTYSIG